MKIKKFNETIGYQDRRYKIDLELLSKLVLDKSIRNDLKIFKKNINYYLESISDMIEKGNGSIYLYSITNEFKIAYIMSYKFSNSLNTVPVESLIGFDLEEYKVFKDSEKRYSEVFKDSEKINL